MMHARNETLRSDHWVAVLRTAVGLWFLKSLFTKIEWHAVAGVLPLPAPSARWAAFLPGRLAEYAAGNPLGWYAAFLDFAVAHSAAFAWLTAFGESAIGIALVLGMATRWAAAGGAFMMANYFLASFWMGPNQQGFHLLLFACMAVFVGANAGLTWGLDGWLQRARLARAGLLPAPARARAGILHTRESAQ